MVNPTNNVSKAIPKNATHMLHSFAASGKIGDGGFRIRLLYIHLRSAGN